MSLPGLFLLDCYVFMHRLCIMSASSVCSSSFSFSASTFLFRSLCSLSFSHCHRFPCVFLFPPLCVTGWELTDSGKPSQRPRPLARPCVPTRLTSPTVSIIEQSLQARRELKTVPRRYQTGGQSVLWWYNDLFWINDRSVTSVPWPALSMCRTEVGKSAQVCTYVAPNSCAYMFLVIAIFSYLKVIRWEKSSMRNERKKKVICPKNGE